MLTSVTNNVTRQGLITLEAYLGRIECLPPHRPRRSRHYDQALLATIPVLDFMTEEGGTQIAQIPGRPISSSHPAIPHDFTDNRADKNAIKTIQIENSIQPYPCKKTSLLATSAKKPYLEPTTGEFHRYWEGGELNLRSERANKKALSLPTAIFTDSIHDTNTSKNTINLSPTHKEDTDMCNDRDFPGTRQENLISEDAEYHGYTPGRPILSVKAGTRRRRLPVYQLTLLPEISDYESKNSVGF